VRSTFSMMLRVQRFFGRGRSADTWEGEASERGHSRQGRVLFYRRDPNSAWLRNFLTADSADGRGLQRILSAAIGRAIHEDLLLLRRLRAAKAAHTEGSLRYRGPHGGDGGYGYFGSTERARWRICLDQPQVKRHKLRLRFPASR
jgi:hypothetical protein